MRQFLVRTTIVAALSIATAASAQPAAETAPAPIKKGERLFTADGVAIGRVEYVQADKDGAGTAAIIYKMHMVHIPLDTVSAGDKGYVTKLSKSDIDELKSE